MTTEALAAFKKSLEDGISMSGDVTHVRTRSTPHAAVWHMAKRLIERAISLRSSTVLGQSHNVLLADERAILTLRPNGCRLSGQGDRMVKTIARRFGLQSRWTDKLAPSDGHNEYKMALNDLRSAVYVLRLSTCRGLSDHEATSRSYVLDTRSGQASLYDPFKKTQIHGEAAIAMHLHREQHLSLNIYELKAK
jgi:hypothetical protein